jgi:hypothetical protein
MSTMATRRESGLGEVLSRSSSADLSSPPQSSPGSPSAQLTKHQNSSIIVNASGVPPPAQPPQRKKPGRKPKVSLENGSSATNTDAPKQRRPRKVKDPNAPVIPRRRKTQPATTEVSTAAQLKAIAGPERLPTPTPKIAESKPATRDSSFEVRPETQARPTSQNGKHEDIPTQGPIHSFFNPPPPPPQQQQPAPSQSQHSPLPLQYVLLISRLTQ